MGLTLIERRSARFWSPSLVAALGLVVVLATILLANRHVLARPATGRPPDPRLAGLTAEFPTDLPLYPQARFVGLTEAQGQIEGRIYDRAWFAVPASGPDVSDWYRRQLRRDYTAATLEDGPNLTGRFTRKKEAASRAIYLEVSGTLERPTMFFVDFYPTER